MRERRATGRRRRGSARRRDARERLSTERSCTQCPWPVVTGSIVRKDPYPKLWKSGDQRNAGRTRRWQDRTPTSAERTEDDESAGDAAGQEAAYTARIAGAPGDSETKRCVHE